MLSPAKMVAAAAVVALSGALLLAGTFTTSDTADPPVAPAAEGELASIVYVDGQVTTVGWSVAEAWTDRTDWGYSKTNQLWTGEFGTSDDRLSGLARFRINSHFGESEYDFGSDAVSAYLENDGGSWIGTGRGYMDAPATEGEPAAGSHLQLTLEGQGDYTGLSAIVSLDQPDSYSPFELTGAITSVPLPAMPDAAPTDFE